MGMIDGMGFEELGQAGSQPSNLWVTGSVITDSFFSGANVYSVSLVQGKNVSLTGSSVLNNLAGSNVLVVGSLLADGALSGANVYAVSLFSGKNVSLTGSAVVNNVAGSNVLVVGSLLADGAISGANVYSVSLFSGKNVSLTGSGTATGGYFDNTQRVAVAGTGSPTTYGYYMQCGSDALSAGSVKWTVFGTAFGAVPIVTVSNMTTINGGGLRVTAANIAAGSFYVEGQAASDAYQWIAVGARA